MATKKDLQITQHIVELEASIYQIRVAIAEKTETKSRLEAINFTFHEDIKKFKTEAETKLLESLNQIQEVIEAKRSEQGLLQNQMRDATSSEKKEWLNERITHLQKFITHFEQGLNDRQNTLTEMETAISQLEQDFVSRKNTVADLDKSILLLEQGLKDKQNTLLTLKTQ